VLCAACGGGSSLGFAVALTIRVDPNVSDAAVASVTQLAFQSSEGESFVGSLSLGRPLAREERIEYLPEVGVRMLDITVSALDASGATVAQGSTGSIGVSSGQTTDASLVLSVPSIIIAALGAACGNDDECQTSNCVDGVCCASSSCGFCAACDVAGHLGECTPVASGADPHHDCSLVGGDAACNSSCDGNGHCLTLPGNCASPTCADISTTNSPAMLASEGQLTTFSCTPAYKCVANAAVECDAPLVCAANGTQCATEPCTSDFDCSDGTFCGGAAVCVTNIDFDATTPCTRDLECRSGYCGPGSTCLDCITDADCNIANGPPLCVSGECVEATDCAELNCAGQGLGDGCDAGSPQCTATSAAACLDPSRPNFEGGLCVCVSPALSASTSCGHGEVCSTAAGAIGARCVGMAGRPCWGNPACASGVCTNHVCATAAAGVLCRTGVECTSGTCSVTASSEGRTVCN
jgi:hypothetical protein